MSKLTSAFLAIVALIAVGVVVLKTADADTLCNITVGLTLFAVVIVPVAIGYIAFNELRLRRKRNNVRTRP